MCKNPASQDSLSPLPTPLILQGFFFLLLGSDGFVFARHFTVQLLSSRLHMLDDLTPSSDL